VCSYSWRVPLTTSGELRIATSWDLLGGLGATEDPVVTYNWTARGLMPQLLPWLAILALLALKPNHGWSAWWIWLPLACLAAGWHYMQLGLQSPRFDLPNDVLNVLIDVPSALAFGVAALWLLGPYVGRSQRFRAFLRMLLVLAVFGVFSFAVTAGWDEEAAARITALPGVYLVTAGWAEGAAQVMMMALLALVITAAMVLSGFACRSRYLPWLCLWLFGSLLVVVFAVGALVYVLVLITSGGRIAWSGFFVPVLVAATVNFATLLPFLILSSASPFFRERLKALLHVKPEVPPPLNMPLPDAQLKT